MDIFDYKQKYFKYKTKYCELKHLIKMRGGADESAPVVGVVDDVTLNYMNFKTSSEFTKKTNTTNTIITR